MAHRYFTQNINNNTAVLSGSDARQLICVLRAKIGDEIILCDGKGIDYIAKVNSFTADEIHFEVLKSYSSVAEPSVWVELYVAYSKGDKLELVIQKAVELGASVIQPFFSTNCVVKPKKEEEKNKRYTRIALEAAKQCGRGRIPLVGMPLSYKEMLEKAKQQELALFLYEKGGLALRNTVKNAGKIAIITGAEGGFTEDEAEDAKKNGCTLIGLGPRILRCETAPIAALSAIMCITGNFE